MKKITFLLLALFLQTAALWALPARSSSGPGKVAHRAATLPKHSISELLFSAALQNDVVLTSAPGTDAQSVCQGNSMTTISYVTFGATGMGTPVGLPAGVTAIFTPMTGYYNSIGFINITGTPAVLGTFNYSIPLTGGTGIAVNATGSITVNRKPAAVTSLSSNAPLCEGGQLNLLAQAPIFSASYSMQYNSGDAFIDIAATGTNVPGSLSDDSKHTIAIPTFNYYGQNYNSATVSSNGIIIFGNVMGSDYFNNQPLPSAYYAGGPTYMAPYWDDLVPGQTSSIKTQTVGDNFIIQYTVLGFFFVNSQPITFQVQLNLVTGAIVFVYSNVVTGNALNTNGKSATVGIQKNTTTAVQYSFNTASLSNGKSIRFNPILPDTYSWTGPNGFSSNLLNPTIPNATTAASGNYQFQVISSQGCASDASTLPVTITPISLLLSSGAETTSQTVNYGAAISPIVYTTNGIISVTGLPPGLSAVTTNNSLVIAGTPTGSGSYQYTLTGSAGCGNNATGTITIVPVFLTSDQTTTNQTVCAGTAITPTVYNGNVTQAVVSGLPAGVTTSIYGNTMTFNGAPATAGNYTYAIAVNGVSTEGTITVNPLPPSPTITSSGATTICEGSSVTLSASVAASVEPIETISGAILATGLHKIVSSYTGPALRLRREGDNAEQDFGFVGNDLDITAISAWLDGANGYCTTLYDQTGHNGNITQNDMFSQPQFVASGLNNRAILHFTTEQSMYNEVAYPATFSVVYGAKVTGASERVLAARYNNWLLGYWSNGMDCAHFDGWIAGTTGVPSNNAFNIYAGTGNGMVSTIYKNGTQLFSGNEGLTAPNGIQINQHQSYGERSDVDFTDIIIYDTELSGQNVGKVNNFIAGYYGGVLGQSTNNFAWSTNENTTQIEVSTAGEYSVRTIGGNGCLSAPSAVTSVSVIAAPTVIVPANQTYCDGSVTSEIALTGTPSDVTFTIQNGAAIGLNDVGGVTAIPSFTAIGGTATVSITPVSNGCSGLPVSFTITVNKTLFNLEASATMVCPDSPVTISTDVAAPLTYCNAINSEAGTTYCKITYVGFGSIYNDTSNDISSDTTIHPVGGTTTTVVQPGEAYLLNVSSTNAGADAGVWIDYNRNGVFESAEFTEVYQDNETGTVNITIPNDATIGQTRMRVRSEYYGFDRVNSNASCDTFSYGTTQDYTITIGQDVQVGTSGTVSWSSDPFDALVSNVTTASITTNPAVTTTYTATVTSATTGCVATKAVTVTVQTGVIITSQPKEFIAHCEGQMMGIEIGATGVGLTYQWYKDGQPLTDGNNITGATAPLLMFNPGPTLNDVGSYTVIIHPLCGEDAVSSASVLTIIPSPTVQPIANQTYCSGAVTSEMALTGTPSNVQYMISGGAAIGLNDGYGFTTIPAFTAVAGTATITVTPYADGCAGVPVTYTITVNQTPTVAISSDAPSVVCPGTAVTVTAHLANPLSYCNSINNGIWACYITNVNFGAINNDTSTNLLNGPNTHQETTVVQPGEIYPLTVSTGSQYVSDVTVWIDYNRNGIYEASENTDVYLSAYTGSVNITIPADASTGKTGMRIRSDFVQRDLPWNAESACSTMAYGTTQDYTIIIGQDVQDVSDNTILWSSDPVDESLSNVNTASITTNPAVTTTYSATVTTPAGCVATASATVNVTNGIFINTQPVAQTTICEGAGGSLGIEATGLNLSYQWYKDGQPLTDGAFIYGAQMSVLSFEQLPLNYNGVYTVRAYSQCGDFVESEPAMLTVLPTPMVEPIANQTYCSGAVTTAIPLTKTARNFQNALRFDGSNDYVSCPNDVVPVTGEFTVSVWAKQFASNGPFSEIFAQGRCLYLGPGADGKIRLGDCWGTDVAFPTDGAWHQYTIVNSLNDAQFYIDGNLVASKGSPYSYLGDDGSGNPHNLFIGSQWFGGGELFDGAVDEFRVWNYARSSNEIQSAMNSELAGIEPGLVAYYNFNQGIANGSNETETTLYNMTANADLNGTLINMDLTGETSNWISGQSQVGSVPGSTFAISGGEAIGLNDAWGVTAIPAFTTVSGTATITVTPTANGCQGAPVTYAVTVNKTPVVSLSSDAGIVCPGSLVTVLANIATTSSYCESYNEHPDGATISTVNFGTIDSNTNNNQLHGPNTHVDTTVVQPGETYTLSVSTNPYYGVGEYVGAWIDYNRNGIYEASEYSQVYQSSSSGSVSITIPTNAAIGKTGMRIRSDAGGTWHTDFQWNSEKACDYFYLGNTEDYTIAIGEDVPDYTISWSSNPMDASVSNATTASITTIPAATTTYTSTVTSLAGCSATATTTVTVQNGVVIGTQPVGQTICQGQDSNFTIGATGVGVTYQWYKDGQPLTDGGTLFGCTTASLLILGSSPNDNGVYTVTVHPQCGDDVVSEGATLIVNPTPTVERIADQSYCTGSIPTMSIMGSPSNVTYAISGGSTIGLNDVEGVTAIPAFTAVAGSATITVTPSANGCTGQPTTFTITVNARPTVALTSSATTAICPGNSVFISAAIAYTEPAPSYCDSYNGNTYSYTIGTVNFGTINSNANNNQMHGPNTNADTTVVQPGETYTLSVDLNPYYDLGYVGAWIDYNRNGIYEASEYSEVFNSALSGSVSFAIPTNAATGKTGMRIRSDYAGWHTDFQSDSELACAAFYFGNTEDYTITIGQDVPAYTIAWSSNPVDASVSNTTTASITPSPVVTTTYTATVTPATGCSTSTSVLVKVLPAITIAAHPASTYICSAVGSTALFTAVTNTAATSYTWQYRVVTTASPNPSWITITSANAGTVYANYSTATLRVTKTTTLPAVGTQYRLVASDACSGSTSSNVAMLTIISTVKAGTITAPASVCLGSDITLTVGGHTGTSLQWQSAPISTTAAPGVFTDILGATSASYTIYGATADVNKSYRVIVSNSCNTTTATTAVKTITVSPVSVSGTITGGGIVCAGSSSTVKVAGNVGTIQWQYATDGVNYYNAPTAATVSTAIPFGTTSTTSTTATYVVTGIATDVYFRAKITSGTCSSIYTTQVQYMIKGKAVAGTIAPESKSLCSGTGTTLTLSEAVGTITWQKATNLTTPVWTAIANSNTLSIETGNLTAAAAYRAMVTIGSCSTEYSNIAYVTMVAKPLAKTIALNTTNPTGATATAALCTTSTAKVLTLGAGSVGDIQWEKSTLSSTAGFSDIVGATGTSYTIANPSVGANYYRVRFSNSCNDVVYSKVVTVYYKDCTPRGKVVDAVASFAIVAYPNPYSDTFNLSLTTTSEDKVGIVVYDMTGRLLERREVRVGDIVEQKIGNHYPTGVYNVVVTQGEEVKTLRVIKR